MSTNRAEFNFSILSDQLVKGYFNAPVKFKQIKTVIQGALYIL